jgi:hypothetical protein
MYITYRVLEHLCYSIKLVSQKEYTVNRILLQYLSANGAVLLFETVDLLFEGSVLLPGSLQGTLLTRDQIRGQL